MKKHIIPFLFAVLMIPAASKAANCDLVIRQLDAFGNEVPRLVSVPSGCAGASGVIAYDAATTQPQIYTIDSTLAMSGRVLSVGTVPMASVSGLSAALAAKFNNPAGSTAQYLRGDGTLATFPSIPVVAPRVFTYRTPSLNTCFQLSVTRDVQVSYSIDVTAALSLGGGARGSVYLRSYTDNTCSASQVTMGSGSSGLPAALAVAIGLQNLGSVALVAVVPAGLWVRIETANDTGTPTFAARQGQEVQL